MFQFRLAPFVCIPEIITYIINQEHGYYSLWGE